MKPIWIETIDDPRIADFKHIPDPVRLRAGGAFVTEGRLAVRRLIANSRFRVRAILVTPAAFGSLRGIPGLEVDAPPVYVASRILGNRRSRRPIVVLEQVGNPDNVGGIFRNAAAFGAAGVLLSPGCCDPLYRKAVRTSIATSLQIPFAVVDDWPGGLDVVRRQGYELVALTPDGQVTCLEHHNFFENGRSVALILGNEGDGLSPEVLAAADATVRISLDPTVDSLNVATTAAIVLYHIRSFNEELARPDTGSSRRGGR